MLICYGALPIWIYQKINSFTYKGNASYILLLEIVNGQNQRWHEYIQLYKWALIKQLLKHNINSIWFSHLHLYMNNIVMTQPYLIHSNTFDNNFHFEFYKSHWGILRFFAKINISVFIPSENRLLCFQTELLICFRCPSAANTSENRFLYL